MRKLTTTHLYVKVSSLVNAITFFSEQLNLQVKHTSLRHFSGAVALYDATTSIFLSEKTYPGQTTEIWLNTHDCLEQYCRLKSNGVWFKAQPHYMSAGLLAEFVDADGNSYFILERRNYQD
ncbi:VOC family protein [Pedobacter nanyangensis]|mgnify:CR=1 FL=1|uniref:hypothetical protein n=1 Tax=Pedobacter nanyangensis TaxID=1562389 RepID=UPI000DE2065A|nr:hypothetical protein [Pedobacter nanyangensis]